MKKLIVLAMVLGVLLVTACETRHIRNQCYQDAYNICVKEQYERRDSEAHSGGPMQNPFNICQEYHYMKCCEKKGIKPY